MLSIQNRQKRLWIVPALFKADGSAAFEAKPIDPGTSAQVEELHWEAVTKDNKVIEALIGMRALVVTRGGRQREDIQDADELENPASPTAPAELTEKDDRVQVDSKVELKEIDLKDDAPSQGKGRK